MLSMYHDYRIFNPSRGFLCLNELDLGVPLKPPMSSIFRQKTTPQTYRSLVIEAKRFSGKEALESGIVDGLGGLEEVLGFVKERGLVDKPKMGVYGVLKREMFRETLGYIDGYEESEKTDEEVEKKEMRSKEEGESRVAEWKRNAAKAKL